MKLELPLSLHGSTKTHATLAHQLQLPGIAGTLYAEEFGFLRFGTVEREGGTTILWGIVDPRDRVSEIRHLDGPELPQENGRQMHGTRYGNLGWPVGIDKIKHGQSIGLVCGVENFLAAQYFWRGNADVAVVAMLTSTTIDKAALPLFVGRDVYLADLDDPQTQIAYDQWYTQLAGAGANVRNVSALGYKFADGRPAHSLWDWAKIQFAEMQEAYAGDRKGLAYR